MNKKIGKYEILEELGRGGMGVVYKGYDSLIEREVAIKVISDVAIEIPEIKSRFYREARTAGKLSHENITIVHDVGEAEGKPYIVMEYLGGSDLRSLLEKNVPMTMSRKIEYAVQICRALAYSHSKEIIHRDIKPANIRVIDDRKVKIMDFGIAKLVSSNLTSPGAIMGTPFYMSPEQIKGLKVDHRSDMFSAGVLIYELMTNRKPFAADEPTSVMYKIVHEEPDPMPIADPKANQGLNRIVMKMLHKKQDDRYKDLDEVADELEAILHDIRIEERTKLDDVKNQLEHFLQESKSHLTNSNFEKALDMAQKASEIEPGNNTVIRLIGEIRSAAEQEKIRGEIEQRLRSANELLDAKKYQESMGILDAVLRMDAGHAGARALLQKAQEALKRQEEEQKVSGLLTEAERHVGSNDLTGAQHLLDEAAALRPQHPQAVKLADKIRARRAEREEEERKRRQFNECLVRGRKCVDDGQYVDAIEALKSALKIFPKDSEAKGLLRKAESAKAADEKERQRKKKEIDKRIAAARKSFKAGKMDDAMKMAQSVLDMDPANDDAATLLRQAYNAAEAQAAANRARTVPPPADTKKQVEHPDLQETAFIDRPIEEERKHPDLEETRIVGPSAEETQIVDRSLEETKVVPPSPPPAVPKKKPSKPLIRPEQRKVFLIAALAILVVGIGLVYRLFFYVPAPPTGYVALNVVPWAEVTKIETANSTQIPLNGKTLTPCRLPLPQGQYKIYLTNPNFEQQLVVTVDVEEGKVLSVTREMPGFDYNKVLSIF